jgi:hypothetical protein
VSPGTRSRFALRVVIASTLAGLLWKVMYFVVFARVYYDWPLRQQFFPAFLESATTFAVSYVAAVAALAGLLFRATVLVRRLLSVIAVGAVSILCVHQGSYNDATFTTSWWAILWSVWFAGRVDDGASTLDRAAWLARGIVAMILLGGAVGKWTDEYWSGQVLYEIYFLDRQFWLFDLLRNTYDATVLREIATWYSRGILVLESAAGLTLWLFPPSAAAITGGAIFICMTVFSNSLLASVTLSMVGLSAVGLCVVRRGSVR